ncbi:MAG: (Fe-S)-binding protein [Kofleriaceae bacterium]|jgi:Fe-S oxidoreductase|nr:(Fe-S)-binding protein [Kofleriaceae bacterium]MBP6840427.1 (Fe-S)-binding protein [Kofleriaceae bacterium]MBP9203325.1 (Fe-S)-binding protein [Kofleriaceae bacterium]
MSSPFDADGVAAQLATCTFCPKMCRHACPVSTTTGHETWIPQAKMAQLGRLRTGATAWSQAAADPLWACTGCRACTAYCEHENEPGLVLLAGRAEAQRRGATPPALDDYAERFRQRDERLAGQLRDLFGPTRMATEGAIGFWPGCDSVGKGSGDIAAALALFDQLGQPVVLIDADQACAGYPLLAAGYRDMFRWHAGKVAQAVRGFSTVVLNCSACLYTMRAQYPAEGLVVPGQVVSLVEFLAAQRSRLAPASRTRRSVYYHDPCHHARYAGIAEAPRLLLGQLAEVREFAWSHGDTECCGGGGLLPKTMPAVADAMARRRLAEVQAQGGGLVVTSCGTCTFMLKRNAPPGVEVADLPTAVARLAGTEVDVPQVADEEE